ncbi:hypothetical protein ACFQMA_11745 [Halosimplex aquaticum]|uniref:Uncharacterized protein n=1 Tax=Halosimplex aquaticum TaxID=3026162 RepID=A0ABD5Y7X5_9EURY|nr:hypothetical protein [Halosimplex aquaticum]
MPLQQTDIDGHIGNKMRLAVKIANRNPLPSKHQLAKIVGAIGSTDYGYQPVNRCLRRDLITVDPNHPDAEPRGQGAVVITTKGREFVRTTERDE